MTRASPPPALDPDAPDARRLVAETFPDVAAAGPLDRRTFLQLLAASLTIAGLGGCEGGAPPADAPLLSQPARTPGLAGGEAVRFATTLELDGHGVGVLATARDGRAIRLDGHPGHPASRGALNAGLQAEILSLHDPHRSRAPTHRGEPARWEALESRLASWRAEADADGGRGLAILLPPFASPTIERLLGLASRRWPEARVRRYAPLAFDGEARGAERAFGRPLAFLHDFAAADAALAVGGDPFSLGPAQLRHAADWAARRKNGTRAPPRLLSIETAPSLFGARADRRVARRPRDIEPFLRAVLASLEGADGADRDAAAFARVLAGGGAASCVIVGAEQPAAVHALGGALNARLGALGRTVRAIEPPRPEGGVGDLAALAEDLAAGRTTRLLALGGNPAFDAPADLDLARLLVAAPDTLHLGLHADETARACRWHAPAAHALESFGDLRAFDGTLSLRQAATNARAPGWSVEEALGRLLGLGLPSRALLAATWAEARGAEARGGEAGSDAAFRAALEAGWVEGTAAPALDVALRADWDRAPGDAAPVPEIETSFDVVFAPHPSLGDGRGAGNAWLQELPHPLTKQVWGNAALLSPATAAALGVARGDLLSVETGGRALLAPAWPLAGHADGAVTLPLGGGRRAAGPVGTGVGFDAYPLRTTRALTGGPAVLRRAGGPVALASTQPDDGTANRAPVRRVAARGDALPDAPPDASFYPEPPRADAEPSSPEPVPVPVPVPAWAMTIDLDACIGCNACVVACQVENNVPAVGPEEAARGREMHWLRVDRYRDGPPGAEATLFQPVPCFHCEKAPCEVACPVNATVHTPDGLNSMVYNRCIGTRTCSNACPYTVRRFNFTDPREGPTATPADALNPQVTVRGRGVMEKCTFCVQRIAEARIAARIEGRAVADGEVVTACESACPTRAITFGNGADPASRVAAAKREARNYALLGELNTRPRVTYLARVDAPGFERPGEGG